MVNDMSEDEAGQIEPEPQLEQDVDFPLLEQARKIEKEMFQVMTTQVKLAIVQIVLATISIVAALVIAALH